MCLFVIFLGYVIEVNINFKVSVNFVKIKSLPRVRSQNFGFFGTFKNIPFRQLRDCLRKSQKSTLLYSVQYILHPTAETFFTSTCNDMNTYCRSMWVCGQWTTRSQDNMYSLWISCNRRQQRHLECGHRLKIDHRDI